jgi:hypothetical protein
MKQDFTDVVYNDVEIILQKLIKEFAGRAPRIYYLKRKISSNEKYPRSDRSV